MAGFAGRLTGWLAEEMTDWESGLTGRASWLSVLACRAGLLVGLAGWLSWLAFSLARIYLYDDQLGEMAGVYGPQP